MLLKPFIFLFLLATLPLLSLSGWNSIPSLPSLQRFQYTYFMVDHKTRKIDKFISYQSEKEAFNACINNIRDQHLDEKHCQKKLTVQLGENRFATTGMKYIPCESIDNKYKECSLPYVISSLELIVSEQYSRQECHLGKTFGIIKNESKMWVDKGCKATFRINE